jgi:hypothetical protein
MSVTKRTETPTLVRVFKIGSRRRTVLMRRIALTLQ